ncbi:MAG: DHH family phosphoesterase, partial [Clostridia bacterium]|nr:DHH family phosphoesterase [Clostridia bacterium]
ETMRKSFWLAVWNDCTDYEELYTERMNSNVIVAYAAVDNINELSSGLQQDRYREISAKISNALNEWVNSMHGIIKEYERDKYLIFFEDRYIEPQIESKFDILDKINELSDETDGLPLTVSIGVARMYEGGLSEKEEAAKNSLQLALQRGGAQVVVKNRTDNDFYGGRTKTIQKRTKIKSRVVAYQLVSLINKASNVLIMGHANPDFDAVASCCGIARLAMWLGKDVKIIEDTENQNYLICSSRLAGIKDYSDMFVDKVYGQELLKPDTLVVICDVSNVNIFESADIYRKAEHIAVIDHHRQIQEFDRTHDITYIEPTASSASELVAEMLEIVLPPNVLLKEEAELMLAGMLLDTQNFARNVGIRTFSAATYLRGAGANTSSAQAMFKYQLGEFKKIAEFERNIFIFRKIFAITQYESDNDAENRVTAAQVAERMLMIDGIRASFTVSKAENAIHISARSDGSVNVSLILEKIGGGGHFDSAGAKMSGVNMKQAMSKLREAIVSYCENN